MANGDCDAQIYPLIPDKGQVTDDPTMSGQPNDWVRVNAFTSF